MNPTVNVHLWGGRMGILHQGEHDPVHDPASVRSLQPSHMCQMSIPLPFLH